MNDKRTNKGNGKQGGGATKPDVAASDAVIDKEAERQIELAMRQAKSVMAKSPLAGPIVWLYMHSSVHKHAFITDLEWMVMPPLVLNQYKLYMKDDAPLAFASWASVDEEVEKRLLSGRIRLAPKDWKSGDRLWLIDLIAPFGGGKDVIKDLRENVFPSRTIKQLMPDADGKNVRPIEWEAVKKGGSN